MRDLGLAYTHTHTIWDRADPAVSEKERESEREMCGELPLSGSSRIWFIKNSSKSAPASAQASCLLGRRFLQSIDAINQSGLRHSPSPLSGPRLWSLVSAHACCMICLQFNEVACVFSSRLPLTAFGRFLTQFLPYAKFSAGIPSQTQTESQRRRQRQSRTKVKWKIFITDYIAIFFLRHRSFCFFCETVDWRLET